MKILVVSSFSLSLLNFRLSLLRELVARGHIVTVVTSRDHHFHHVKQSLATYGIDCLSVQLSRSGTNPFIDLICFSQLLCLISSLAPDVVFPYTIKPVIYCGFASIYRPNFRLIPLITGLGYPFVEDGSFKRNFVRFVAEIFYKCSLFNASHVIFQNPDDLKLFKSSSLLSRSTPTSWVPGSGVDLGRFSPSPPSSAPIFLMLSRLLLDKGVRNYYEAASYVKKYFPQAIFRLAGGLDPNPAGISSDELESWNNSGVIEYLGNVADVKPLLDDCRFYVLPTSYREGVPRSILEALAVGRPIITTDTPGCRLTVDHGHNGFLVKPRDSLDLSLAMVSLLTTADSVVADMANYSRQLARSRFNVSKVNRLILDVIEL